MLEFGASHQLTLEENQVPHLSIYNGTCSVSVGDGNTLNITSIIVNAFIASNNDCMLSIHNILHTLLGLTSL